jgi:diacylglycerol kinase family enzyme
MEIQRRPAPVWIVLFDRFVARWLFAFIALSALGLACLTVLTHGWVHLVLSLLGHLAVAVVAVGIAVLTRSSARRRWAVICLLGDLAAMVPNLFGVGGHQWRGLSTAVLLLPVFVAATRGALRAQPVDAIVGGVQPTPAVEAARSEVASQVPPAEVRNFQKPVLVLNPRSGSVQAARDELLAAASRYGVEVREAPSPAELVEVARGAVADGADVLGVAGGDGSLAAVAMEAELPFVCVPAGTRNHFARDLGLDRDDPAAAIEAFVAGPERRVDIATVGDRIFLNNASIGVYAALVHEPSYRDDRLGAIDSLLESMLERDTLPVRASFQDGSRQQWDQVMLLFVSNNAYPLSGFGSRSRLDAGLLEVSALRPTDGQDFARALELLARDQYRAGEGWARWGTTSFEVDSPSGELEVGIDGEPVLLDTPIEFKIHAGALRVLLPPARPPSRSTRPSKRPSRRGARQLVGAASASGGQAAGGWQSRAEQLGRLARTWQLLDGFVRHTFQTERDQYGRPVDKRSRPPSGPGERR